MEAKVGDEIVVDGVRTGDLSRKGEILEILNVGDVTHYRIRWDDGQDSLFYPGSTAHVVHLGGGRGKRNA
jgi:uncharacterized protein DUF1918